MELVNLKPERFLGHKTSREEGICGQTDARYLQEVKTSIYMPPGTFQVLQTWAGMLSKSKMMVLIVEFCKWRPSQKLFDGIKVARLGMCTVQVPGGYLSAQKVLSVDRTWKPVKR